MDATTTVKAEIKAWERDFRAQHGRNATVEDIKALPHIAEKYKLHKKLAKGAEAKSARVRQALDQPKTPPRAIPKHPNYVPPAAILSKSRPVASATDVTTNNPFSPVKRKAGNAAASSSTANPFLTPLKAPRARSPDPSPPSPAPPLVPAPPPAAAVSRARKRLRGEPVSPSPKPGEKRRRLDSLNSTDKMGRISRSPSSSPPAEEGDSFVDDSPVKASANGKTFKPLFEEVTMPVVMPSLSQPTGPKIAGNRGKAFARAKTVPGGLFGGLKKDAKRSLDLEVFGENSSEEINVTTTNGKWKGKDKEQSVDGAQKSGKKRVLPGPKGLIPGKDDLFEINSAAAGSSSSAPSRNTNASRKRSLSVAMKERAPNAWDLLPPSPPPPDDSRWQNGNGKGKAKLRNTGKGKSKKKKLSPDGSDEEMEDLPEDADIKIVSWRGRAQSPLPTNLGDTVLALDPELQFHLRGRQADVSPPSVRLEKFEVDLPDEMRRVLALSPSDRERERKEEDVVRGLMKGVRRGGVQVWGPGEIGGEGKESDEDVIIDDWEGEGIPWEVAEL